MLTVRQSTILIPNRLFNEDISFKIENQNLKISRGLPSSGSLQGNLHSLLPLISSLYHIMGVYRRSQRLARKGCYTIPFDLTLLQQSLDSLQQSVRLLLLKSLLFILPCSSNCAPQTTTMQLGRDNQSGNLGMNGDPHQYQNEENRMKYITFLSLNRCIWSDTVQYNTRQWNAMGQMVEGCLRPKAMIHLSPCPQGPRGIQPKRLPLDSRPFLSFYSLVDGRKKVSYRTGQ